MRSKNIMELRLLSLSQNESFARSVVGAFATQLNPTLEQIADIKTAVSEAVTNSIIHAYPNLIGDIRILAELDTCKIDIKIEDFGIGIKDIEQARQPFFSTVNDDSRSGMGFTVMETFMDDVTITSVCDKGTTVNMSKTIHKQDD